VRDEHDTTVVAGLAQRVQHGLGAVVHRHGGERGLLGQQARLARLEVSAGQGRVEAVPRQVDGHARGTECGECALRRRPLPGTVPGPVHEDEDGVCGGKSSHDRIPRDPTPIIHRKI
jgi:hypothetical protein